MKKYSSFFVLVVLLFSCNKDLVQKPDNLIDEKVMKDIFYDMTILDALKYQDPNSLYKNGINPKTYIFKKYKIDSLQFAKSNAYYAANYREYRKMFDDISNRINQEKEVVDLINKKAEKKEKAIGNKIKDSIQKINKAKELKIKKKTDSIAKIEKVKELKIKNKADSILKVKNAKELKLKKKTDSVAKIKQEKKIKIKKKDSINKVNAEKKLKTKK